MKHKAFLLLTVLILGTIYGCKENKVDEYKNQAIFEHYKKDVQTFVLSEGGTQTIIGEEGTKIVIDINILETVDGEEITGDVEIQLTEYYSTTDIILSNLSTSSDNMLIETGGMINLAATSNGQEVVVKKGEAFDIEFSSNEKEGMQIFYGEIENEEINWKLELIPDQMPEDGSPVTQEEVDRYFEEFVEIDSVAMDTTVSRGVSLMSAKFGWINCDRFLTLENLTKLTINYDTIYQPSVFLVYNEINSIVSCISGKKAVFNNVPVGYEVTLIAFCNENGKETYFTSMDLVIEEGKEVRIEFEEVSLEKLKEEIKTVLE